mgnify:CR=1 FL=1|jgi:hypothetical protein
MFSEIIKKSQHFTEEIKIAIAKILDEKQEKVILPEPFDGFIIQLETDEIYPGEPLEFREFGQDRDGYFYLIVTDL